MPMPKFRTPLKSLPCHQGYQPVGKAEGKAKKDHTSVWVSWVGKYLPFFPQETETFLGKTAAALWLDRGWSRGRTQPVRMDLGEARLGGHPCEGAPWVHLLPQVSPLTMEIWGKMHGNDHYTSTNRHIFQPTLCLQCISCVHKRNWNFPLIFQAARCWPIFCQLTLSIARQQLDTFAASRPHQAVMLQYGRVLLLPFLDIFSS